jgi:hypothetical protein|tara:strand:+ start:506 stop:1201 length:696 start_codon:yes stop_codon:yes gene_type:complete
MAGARAQHVIRELGELLESNGAEVTYAIHLVAGRMPGHMNVLLAEANVPYDQLIEMEDINPRINNIDVAVVIGANDVVNPFARNHENSPIYRKPIINVDHARTVLVLKRSMASGFSGVDNPFFFGENTRMLFGDAKESISAVVGEFRGRFCLRWIEMYLRRAHQRRRRTRGLFDAGLLVLFRERRFSLIKYMSWLRQRTGHLPVSTRNPGASSMPSMAMIVGQMCWQFSWI